MSNASSGTADPQRALADELARIRDVFIEAVWALDGFVRMSQRSIGEEKGVMESLVGKLKAGGRILRPASDGEEEVALSDEEADLILKATETYSGSVERFPNMLFEMALIYVVALFDAYMSDSFLTVLKARPELMRSSKRLTYEEILAKGSSDELIAHMAEREIGEVSYKPVADQIAYHRERFGVELTEEAVETLVEMMARRNLLVHNNGKVNDVYLRAVPASDLVAGARVEVDTGYWDGKDRLFQAIARAVTDQLVAKFAPAR